MRFKFLTLLVLVFIRLNFPEGSSIAAIIRKRYGDEILKEVRHFEKLDKRCRKLRLDFDFIESCILNDVIPKFVRFKVVNCNLKNSDVYRTCQINLLNEELRIKKRLLEEKELGRSYLYDKLSGSISYLDYIHIYNVITTSNEKDVDDLRI